jgi:prolyl-tRNA editing enzyme YbaK/EbsC (Cys-tRNA(Pro) deacylase)
MDLHPNARRVQDVLAAAGVEGRVRELHASARTSAEAAEALGVEVGQIAKTLVFLADGRPVIVIASGSDRVDVAALARVVTVDRVKRADADAVKSATGYSIGGVSPAGLPSGVEVLIDTGLSRYEVIWAAAGTHYAVYPTSFADLVAVTGGRVVDVAE